MGVTRERKFGRGYFLYNIYNKLWRYSNLQDIFNMINI